MRKELIKRFEKKGKEAKRLLANRKKTDEKILKLIKERDKILKQIKK